MLDTCSLKALSPRSSAVPGMVLSRMSAVTHPTAMLVDRRTVIIWSISGTPSISKQFLSQHIQSIARPRFSNEAYATKLRGVVIILGMRTAIAPRKWLPWRHGHDQMFTATVGVMWLCACVRYWPYGRVCEYVLPCRILILLTCNNIVIDKKMEKNQKDK